VQPTDIAVTFNLRLIKSLYKAMHNFAHTTRCRPDVT